LVFCTPASACPMGSAEVVHHHRTTEYPNSKR
jgi:hypothetical protein